jgi:predicted Zn-dependent protease
VYDWYTRAVELLEGGNPEAAAALLAHARAREPDSASVLEALGLSRMRLGDHKGAIDELAMAAAMRPGRKVYDQALREARATLRFRQQGADSDA